MKFKIDHDLHIHSQLSLCSGDPEQNPQAILEYAKKNNLKKICITDHFWDENVPDTIDWYAVQNFEHISRSKPLPQDENVKFCFGCEAEMDKYGRIGVSKERYDEFDFIIVPTTHLHMSGFTIDEEVDGSIEGRAEVWLRHMEALLDSDLPAGKTGIAHPTCGLIGGNAVDLSRAIRRSVASLSLITDDEYERIFKRVAEKNYGVELNFSWMFNDDWQIPAILRPYFIAKNCGCKFYLGSDAHTPEDFNTAMLEFQRSVDYLHLTEDDKYEFVK